MRSHSFETTANTLAFACYLLARPGNEEKQAAIVAEVDAFGRNRDPVVDDMDNLPYIDAVLKETMRMYPPGHLIPRVAERDMNLGGTALITQPSCPYNVLGIQRSVIARVAICCLSRCYVCSNWPSAEWQ